MIGDATLFQRADMVEAGWSVIQPISRRVERAARARFPELRRRLVGPKRSRRIAGARRPRLAHIDTEEDGLLNRSPSLLTESRATRNDLTAQREIRIFQDGTAIARRAARTLSYRRAIRRPTRGVPSPWLSPAAPRRKYFMLCWPPIPLCAPPFLGIKCNVFFGDERHVGPGRSAKQLSEWLATP